MTACPKVPLQTIGDSRLVEDARSRLPGLSVVNTSRLVNSTLNNNEIVRLARELALEVMASAPVAGGING
jgi:hypothetical protein